MEIDNLFSMFNIDIPGSTNFAVIDTETNWDNQVMSIGIVIADGNDFSFLDSAYFIIDPEYRTGGMFDSTLFTKPGDHERLFSRCEAIEKIKEMLNKHNVNHIFAYNANFDFTHLPELQNNNWYDILKIAAYKQYNFAITSSMECCTTGRLKKNYTVECIYRMLAGSYYSEQHNALDDAVDELEIMKMLKQPLDVYLKKACIHKG